LFNSLFALTPIYTRISLPVCSYKNRRFYLKADNFKIIKKYKSESVKSQKNKCVNTLLNLSICQDVCFMKRYGGCWQIFICIFGKLQDMLIAAKNLFCSIQPILPSGRKLLRSRSFFASFRPCIRSLNLKLIRFLYCSNSGYFDPSSSAFLPFSRKNSALGWGTEQGHCATSFRKMHGKYFPA